MEVITTKKSEAPLANEAPAAAQRRLHEAAIVAIVAIVSIVSIVALVAAVGTHCTVLTTVVAERRAAPGGRRTLKLTK